MAINKTTQTSRSINQGATELFHRLIKNITTMQQTMNRLARNMIHRGFKSTIIKLVQILQTEGMRGISHRLFRSHRVDYTRWVREYDTIDKKKREQISAVIKSMPFMPKISVILPVYNPPLDMLNMAIQSVRNQLYPNWELCIADDASKTKEVIELLKRHSSEDSRIKLTMRSENGHISQSSNSALELATGEFVALFDHDDLLPEHALFWVADAIIKYPEAGIIYSDEDKIDLKGNRQAPYFKTDWNPDLFLSQNLISHLGVYRTSLLREIGGFRTGLEGSQDYDLALRCIERIKPEQIIHIPRVLYHWRIHSASTASSTAAKPYTIISGERALNEHLKRCNIAGRAEHAGHGYRIHYDLPLNPPLVSLIIPTRNGLSFLRQCIESILTKTTYPNYEILVIDNGSDDPEIMAYFANIAKHPNLRVIRDDQPFNYSAINNDAVKRAHGTILGLINNDIEVISPNWLSEMVSLALQPGAGAIGAKLLYPNNTVQHAGVIMGIGGVADHTHKHFPRDNYGYCGRASLISNYSAVTGACLIVKKSIYNEVNGLNETDLKVAFNDVDFCLKIKEAGYRNIWTPYAELYHHESVSRGRENTATKKNRYLQEMLYMKHRWNQILLADPAYSPNLTIKNKDFSFAWPPRI
jgi:glycosyltransferase involved in cell wall biosynthesis